MDQILGTLHEYIVMNIDYLLSHWHTQCWYLRHWCPGARILREHHRTKRSDSNASPASAVCHSEAVRHCGSHTRRIDRFSPFSGVALWATFKIRDSNFYCRWNVSTVRNPNMVSQRSDRKTLGYYCLYIRPLVYYCT